MVAAIRDRLGQTWNPESDAVPFRDRIEMDGVPIAMRPDGLEDHEWQAVCVKLSGRRYPVLYAVSSMPAGWDNLADVRAEHARYEDRERKAGRRPRR